MAEGEHETPHGSASDMGLDSGQSEQSKPALTRRDFLIRSKGAAVAIGVVTGAGFADGQSAHPPAPAARPQSPQPAALPPPMSERHVTLNIDGRKHDVTVDVRESLWETMNYQLGLSNSNLGCDRAQCGACAVLVDGKAVNGCTVLSARLGRGQKILTVAGITSGPGAEGLHPVQRAFWLDGGFQCGICTRGFVMSAYALLQTTKNPTDAQIEEALAGNICRCGEYTKISQAVKTAAAEMRGEAVKYSAPLLPTEGVQPAEAAATEQLRSTSKQFEFVTALGTIEQFDELALALKQRPGILDVSGTERTITPVWDPAKMDEAQMRRLLAEIGHPVRP